MSKSDVISWNSIILGHCNDPYAVAYFQQMEKSDILPDSVTFISVLSACANLGFMEEGRRFFVEMQNKYRIKPRMEHFACMVNLFRRAGLITEAYEMIVQKMVSNASPTVWGALLYACSLHGNVDVGEIAAEKLFELEPDNAHNFELLMMIYGKAGRWEDVEKVGVLVKISTTLKLVAGIRLPIPYDELEYHLTKYGFLKTYRFWNYHGEVGTPDGVSLASSSFPPRYEDMLIDNAHDLLYCPHT
ncbi:hypothetical protein GIB67_005308 [Kingdonia uniflora]|uniref:Pentatricopeptide repeat-containing protein n=1 Tax=Kingdonia uniflora TaxID=39325 RepID=A0A7J7MBR8_9MAGN|nr:hypothetical protein GIB67_005308 [Kingdonia uniflora]